ATAAPPLGAHPPAVTRPAGAVTAPAPAVPQGLASEPAPVARPSVFAGRLAPIALALAVAGSAGGYALGHSGGAAGTAGLGSSALVDHVQLDYPGSWRASSTVAPVPGLDFKESLRLAPPQPGAGLTAGEVLDAAGPTLLAAP